MAVIIVFKFLYSHLVQIIAQHSIIKIDKFSQMSVHKECSVCVAKLRCADQLHLNHSEFVLGCCSRCLNIKINIFNV